MDIIKIFGKQPLEFKCPKCAFVIDVYLKEMWVEDRLICRGCKSFVRLIDKTGSVEKSRRDINKALSELQETISKTIIINI